MPSRGFCSPVHASALCGSARSGSRRRGQQMSEFEELDVLEEDGFTRRDVFVKGGLLAAGATVLGAPGVAAAAAERTARGPRSMRIAVITHGAGDTFWAVAHKGA